jgi:hypothetical protein
MKSTFLYLSHPRIADPVLAEVFKCTGYVNDKS